MGNPSLYLAGPFGTKLLMRERRDKLEELGYVVRARWIDEDHFTSDTVPSQLGEAPSTEYLARYAEIDKEDTENCDIFIVFPGSGAGHHAEFGMALALHKMRIIVGEKNCIFHHLPGNYWVKDWDTLLKFLQETWPNGYYA